jgi:hypothetical protein
MYLPLQTISSSLYKLSMTIVTLQVCKPKKNGRNMTLITSLLTHKGHGWFEKLPDILQFKPL